MDKLQKQIIFWLGSALLLFLSVFVAVSTNQKLNTAATTNVVTFGGEGKVSAKPDIAVANFSIVTQAASSKAAQDENSKKSQALTAFLKKQGVADKDIKTVSYNVYPQYSSGRSCPPGALCPDFVGNGQQIASYQVDETIEVKIRDLTKASAIVDGAVATGVNQINQLQFSIENPDKFKNEARAKAIADAKSKADNLKRQLGIRLGRIVNFSENQYSYPIGISGKVMETAGRGGTTPSEPSLPAGENEITVDVSITYQIK